jgi:ABC-type multidrug transport system fused ATPase/permease subunit
MPAWILINSAYDLYPTMTDGYLQNDDKTLAPLPEVRVKQSSALVQIDGVLKSFGYKMALKNVTFSVPSGQICGLLGPTVPGKRLCSACSWESLRPQREYC